MTTFVSDNPGTPVSDSWDQFYETVHEDCAVLNFNPMKALRVWRATLGGVERSHISTLSDGLINIGGE